VSAAAAPVGRRERNRQTKIKTILDTAMSLVVEGGIEAMTIHAIARKLDWAVGAMYRYFPSKDALLAELQCRVIAEYRVDMMALLDKYERSHSDKPLWTLALTARHYAYYLHTREAHFRLISLALTDSKQYLPDAEGLKVMAEVHPILQRLTNVFERAQQQKAITVSDIASCTLVYWTAVQGVLSMKKLERFAPDQLNNERLLRHTLDTLFTGWGASHQNVEQAFLKAEEWLK